MKYAGLQSFLASQRQPRLKLTFAEIVRRAGVSLPASAYGHAAWWANDSKSHVQAKAWLEAGYKTENVDLALQRVEFVRVPVRGVREVQNAFDHQPGASPAKHPAAGLLKGVFSIRNWDVTKPALDPGEYAEWEANTLRKMDEIKKGSA